jgi:type 1 glutamine amidotransferase
MRTGMGSIRPSIAPFDAVTSVPSTAIPRADCDTVVPNMRIFSALFLLALGGAAATTAFAQGRGGVPGVQGQNPNGMHVYLWGGLKSHGPGQHDYPQFLADWSKLLTEHGAVVEGALHGPSAADLQKADVVVIYKGDVGYLTDTQKTDLEAYVKRGGGIVTLHDSLCGPDPAYFATLVGGGKKHGETNFTLDAPIPYTVVDKSNPIMKDMSDMTIWDEAFFLMTWAKDPPVHVLVNATVAATPSAGEHKGEIAPQMWTWEHTVPGGQPARAFVWMQGHTYANFANYQLQRTLLRGIAWAGKHPVDELVDYVAPVRPAGGGRGGRGGAPGGAPAPGAATQAPGGRGQ